MQNGEGSPVELSPEQQQAMEKMLSQQEERARASRESMQAKPEETVWEVEQPRVHFRPEKGSRGDRGFARGQVETVGRGSRHYSHPADNEKVVRKA